MAIKINGITVAGSGKDGVTFTPSITDGVLSWTNDGGLENPPDFEFGQSVSVDATLSISGMAADAKAVGDALSKKANSNDIYNKTEIDSMLGDIETLLAAI